MSKTRRNTLLLLALLGGLFFLPFLGRVHLFDWDEINFAECAREMLLLGDYLRLHIDFEPFWEKPPLFVWLQALSMKLFGVGEYAARFPNALCGMLTLALLYDLGTRLYSHRFGLLWAGAYFGSLLPHLYFRSGIIDPWFNLFIFLSLYFLIRFYWHRQGLFAGRARQLLWAGLFAGLAMLTKGPTALLILLLCLGVYGGMKGFRRFVSPWTFLGFCLLAGLLPLLWLGLETQAHGPWFGLEFIKYHIRLFATPDAGHGGFPGFHVVVLLVGCFPASIFAARGFFLPRQGLAYQSDFRRWMGVLFWVVLILFSLVQSKIVHYSSLCYYPLTFFAALTLDRMLQGKVPFKGWLKAGLLGIGLLLGLVVLLAPFVGMNALLLEPYIGDPSGKAALQAEVAWTGWEAVAGLWLLGVLGLSFRLFQRQQTEKASGLLFGGMAVFVFLTLSLFVSKIEQFSQGAAIAFFEEKQGQEVIVAPIGYKTYAHLFYTRKQATPRPPVPQAPPASFGELLQELKNFQHPRRLSPPLDRNRLLNGEMNQPVFIITKIHKAPPLRALPQLEEIEARNGFVFFRRRD
jgi:4-amino-4-deoxy-L-arabinose transferase-like glycosyltransferase